MYICIHLYIYTCIYSENGGDNRADEAGSAPDVARHRLRRCAAALAPQPPPGAPEILTRTSKSEIRKPKSCPDTRNLPPDTLPPHSAPRNPNPEIRTPKSELPSPARKPDTRNLPPDTSHPHPETRNPDPKP